MGIKFWGCTTYLFQSFWLYKIFEKDLCFAIELLQGRNYYIIAPRPAYHLGKNKNNSITDFNIFACHAPTFTCQGYKMSGISVPCVVL